MSITLNALDEQIEGVETNRRYDNVVMWAGEGWRFNDSGKEANNYGNKDENNKEVEEKEVKEADTNDINPTSSTYTFPLLSISKIVTLLNPNSTITVVTWVGETVGGSPVNTAMLLAGVKVEGERRIGGWGVVRGRVPGTGGVRYESTRIGGKEKVEEVSMEGVEKLRAKYNIAVMTERN